MNFDDLYTNVFENQTRLEINPFEEVFIISKECINL